MPVMREGAAVALPDGTIAVLGGGASCGFSEGCGGGTVYNGSVPVTTQHDAEDRTMAISESAQGTTAYTSTFGYNADDQPTTVTVPGGVRELAQFDPGSRLRTVSATGPATATNPLNSGYSYGYTALGWTNATTTTVNTVNGGQPVVQTYTHDPLGRVTSVQGPSGTQRYGYDANDNLTAITTSAGATTYAYTGSAANELTSVSAPSQPITSYGYDSHGNTTSITDTAGATTGLSYDKQERLVGVTLTNGTHVAMAYNAQGQRASYIVTPLEQGTPSLSETFTYREDDLGQAVVTGTGVTTPYTDTYLYGLNGAPLELLRQSAGQSLHRYWYVLDGRGNVVALTDSGGNVVDRYGYDVWGTPIAAQTSETVAQPFRYASYWYDKELGWYWVTLRSYNPVLGRWLQPDPGVAGGGLYGERNGWYRAGFDDSAWPVVTTPDDWAARGLRLQGIGWYRTSFSLDLPASVDAPLGLTIPHASDKVLIWLNGLLIGQYWEQAGPQHTFYLPAGLLREHGHNTLALAVWNRGHDGGLTGGVSLQPYTVSAQAIPRASRG